MKKKKKMKVVKLHSNLCHSCDLYKAPCRGDLKRTECIAHQPRG